MTQGKVCRCPHHKMVPLFITLLGLVFLLGNVGVLSGGFVGIAWPILLLLIGLQKLSRGMCKCCANP